MEAEDKKLTQLKVLSIGDILPPSLQESVDKIVEEQGYITHKIFRRSVSTNGGNFMANLYEVTIKGKTADGEKETNIFIKNKIEDSIIEAINIEECYSVESFFYGRLCKIYNDIQNKANIPVKERYNMVKSYEGTTFNAIILENLNKKGFSTLNRMDVLPLEFAEISIQQLARFHGLSWVLEKQQPEYFAKEIKNLTTNFIFADDYQRYIDLMITCIDKCLDDKKKIKLHKFESNMLTTLKNYWNIKNNSGIRCCLCHGDFRANNILMKKNGDVITEVIPVDYQLLNYGCPVMDFIFFIFPSSDQEFRRKHIDHLKNVYYESLDRFLKYFDMDAESVYPRYEFEAEYKKRLDFGLIMCLVLVPILFVVEDAFPDVHNQDMSTWSLTMDPKMDERIRGIVEDFEMWGIL